MTTDFTDQLVVVTGGTGVLGSAVVRRILDAGGRVAVPALNQNEADRATFADHPNASVTVAGDLADEDAAAAFFDQHARGLTASIHIAGGFAYAPVADADAGLFEQQMRMNATSCYNCCRAAIGLWRDAECPGRIVNTAAKPALHHHEGANMAAYTASKAAVAALTGALAEEVKADGILINAVVPSIMDTPANRAALPDADHAAWPTVHNIAATVCFLASLHNTTTRGGLVPVFGKS